MATPVKPKGRPKLSADVPCKCERCGLRYSVPEWQPYGRKFCSPACFHQARLGKPAEWMKVEPEPKQCGRCGSTFLTRGAGRPPRTAKFCSTKCAAAALGYQPAPREMSDVEAAWLAGLFDGEGNICLSRRGYKNSVRISIANCCMPLLEHVIAVTGTGKLNSKGPPQKANHAQGYTWACYSTNAHAVLKRILPWLIVKREEALAILF